MISFKKFLLLEGGNVVLNGEEAERIDLTKHNRTEIVSKIGKALSAINAAFKKKTGKWIWVPELERSKQFLSGSAFHFFNDQIPDAKFVKYKSSVGDIDTQVPKELEKELKDFLTSSEGQTFGPVRLIGHKTTAGQHISLWHLKDPGINIQIDLEMVDFDDKGFPTEWAQFSHSSDWDDLQVGIKGVAQKMLLRALQAPKLKDVVIKAKTPRGKDKEALSAMHAFSVTHGIRQKLKPALDDEGKQIKINGKNAYYELGTSESSGETNLSKMFEYFFGKTPSKSDLKKFSSFTGLIDLIKSQKSKSDWVKIADGFVNTLWGPSAQGLYRGDAKRDEDEKTAMIELLCKELGIDPNKYNKIKSVYYANYR